MCYTFKFCTFLQPIEIPKLIRPIFPKFSWRTHTCEFFLPSRRPFCCPFDLVILNFNPNIFDHDSTSKTDSGLNFQPILFFVITSKISFLWAVLVRPGEIDKIIKFCTVKPFLSSMYKIGQIIGLSYDFTYFCSINILLNVICLFLCMFDMIWMLW